MLRYPEIGEQVTWESQSAGHWKRTTGTVLEIIPKGNRAQRIPPETLKSHVKFDGRTSMYDRALVAVPAGKDGQITHYYAPRISALTSAADRIPEEHKDYLMEKFTKVE